MSNIIFVTAMHGRHETVLKCINNMPNIRRLWVYTDESDADLVREHSELSVYYPNSPLSFKWESAILNSSKLEWEGLVVLGSDDYIDQKFIDFVSENIKKYDFIGFKDIYFEQNDRKYYWGGYKNERRGEPIGAGRVYSRSFLERLGFSLYDKEAVKGLDGIAWDRIRKFGHTKLITTLRENDLYMADVKDGTGMTSLRKIPNLKRV